MIVEKKDTKPFSFYLSFISSRQQEKRRQPNNSKKLRKATPGLFYLKEVKNGN
jgi:hypothetical protein